MIVGKNGRNATHACAQVDRLVAFFAGKLNLFGQVRILDGEWCVCRVYLCGSAY